MAITKARLGAAAAVVSTLACLAACDAPAPSNVPGSPPPGVTARPTEQGPRPTRSTRPTPTIAPTAAPTESPVGPLEWQFVDDFPAEGAIEVASVAAWGEGFIAVGWEPAPGEDLFGLRQGVVWRTDDGRVWERTTDEAFANATLLHVVPVGETLYVFGFLSVCPLLVEGCRDVPDAGIAVWRSTGAEVGGWERVPQPRQLREALLDGVVATGRTLIAYGSSGMDLQAAMWLSEDAAEWRRIDELAGMDPVSAVAAQADGFVAFGSTYDVDSDTTRTVAARSDDGQTVAAAALDGELDAIVEDIADGPNGFVAVGTSEDFATGELSAAVLVSDDGASWTSVETGTVFAGFGLHSVLAIPGGYAAIGYARIGTTGEREQARTWESTDGLTWHRTGTLTGVYREFKASAVGEPGAIAFAVEYEDEFDEAAESLVLVWSAPLGDGAGG